ncbi:MAG TPA: hypothetical protein VGK99_23410, partial [Acidobacteriota bacterium]
SGPSGEKRFLIRIRFSPEGPLAYARGSDAAYRGRRAKTRLPLAIFFDRFAVCCWPMAPS